MLLMDFYFRLHNSFSPAGKATKIRISTISMTNDGSSLWTKGSKILQYLQDKVTLEKKIRQARDHITMTTKCEEQDDPKHVENQNDDTNNVFDISQFCSQNM